MPERILIIKHGAFGDIILATGALKAIRERHRDAHITLLTTKPFVSLLAKCPWLDEVRQDERSWSPSALLSLLRVFWSRKFDVVYDLQTSDRSSFYWWLMPIPKPRWSGIARFSSHRHNTPHRTQSHTLDRLKEQLVIAGVMEAADAFQPDITWMSADVSRFQLQKPYALLVPGGSAHRPEKRWPAERYAELVQVLLNKNIRAVLIGGEAERDVLSKIEKIETCVNLCGQTSFEEIAELARGAALAVGNDTGPTHVIAAAGCPTIALFATNASNPDLCAPKGEHVSVIKANDLFYLPVHDVMHAVKTAAIP